MKYIYGPLNSRRLGLSLGISLTSHKVCSFNCVYCQLGRTTLQTRERKEYVPIQDILNELSAWLGNNRAAAKDLNYITLSGSGEPTLYSKIDILIPEIKKITAFPLAVITNSSLLPDPLVRQALNGADLIMPSLDAVSSAVWEKIDQPHTGLNIGDIINGLIALRKEFKGKIWLEVMLVKGINDDLRQIKKLKEVIERIKPDKIHLNSPVRSTAEENIFPIDKGKLKKIQKILGENCEII